MLAKHYDIVGAGIAPTVRKTVYDSASPDGRDATREGAFSVSSKLRFDVNVSRRLGASGVVLRIAKDGQPYGDIPLEIGEYSDGADNYSVTLALNELCGDDTSGLFYYEFLFLRGWNTLFTDSLNNVDFELSDTSENRFRLLVYSNDYKVPEWFGKNIIYHIFVDRFAKSEANFSVRDGAVANNDWYGGIPQYAEVPGGEVANNMFFGGTLDGIVQKLDYLESLGVGTLYLSPIFDSASNHKYDTGDYAKIDEMFGGEAAFDRLVHETKKRGMKIMLDGVFNHTGDDSRYFNRYSNYDDTGAYESMASPYFKWYNFRNYPDEYECWWNVKIMPRLRHDREECRRYFTAPDGIGARYIKRGVDAWRLDVADELNDDFLDEFRSSVKAASGGEAIVLGEVWENAADKQAYGVRRRYLQGKQLDSVMNYPLRNGILGFVLHGDGQMLYDILTEIYSSYPRQVCDALMNLLGTHDTERILTVLADADTDIMTNTELAEFRLTNEQRSIARKRLMLASVLQYTVYGTPSLYYGDEAGIEGGRDPFCRMPFPWGCEDNGLLEHYRRLGELRKNESVYAGGEFEILDFGDGYFAFARFDDKDRIVTLINAGQGDRAFSVPVMYKNVMTNEHVCDNVMLKPMEFAILKEEVENGDD